MVQTIRRSGKGLRRTAASTRTRARVASARRQTGGVFSRVLAALALPEAVLYRLLVVGIVGGVGALVVVGALVAGVPAMVEQHVAALADQTGFKVKQVTVRGVSRANERAVYEKVLGQRDQVMSRLNLDAVRAAVITLPWVKDARVSRQLPDRLVVDVIERRAHMVLRASDGDRLMDETGHAYAPAPRAHKLLIVTGGGVVQQIAALDSLLDAAPALKAQVAQAEWIGARRWNLTFRTGQVLALPEGDSEAAAALVEFARMDGVDRLLGGTVAAFDMRNPDKSYFRVPGHSDEIAAQTQAAAAAKAARAAASTAAVPN